MSSVDRGKKKKVRSLRKFLLTNYITTYLYFLAINHHFKVKLESNKT